ncbi:hypothetical protein Tco_1267919 [Tanacetum coccineum]
MASSTIYTAFLLFLMVIGAKLIVSQEECTETHSLLACTKDRCTDLCKDKYGVSLSFKKQKKKRPHHKGLELEPIPLPEPLPEPEGSISTWGECKNVFRCRCHFESPSDD